MADDRNSLSNEIGRLHRLKEDGALTEAEFAEAKRRLIASAGRAARDDDDDDDDESGDLGRAANRFVTYEKKKSTIGLVIFVALFLFVFLPFACHVTRMGESNRGVGGGLPPEVRRMMDR